MAIRQSLLTAALVMTSGGIAMADVAQYKGNTAYTISNNTAVRVCDGDKDGNSVYSKFDRATGTNQRVEVFTGATTCRDSATGSAVIRHNVCVNLSLRPDPCSGFVSP